MQSESGHHPHRPAGPPPPPLPENHLPCPRCNSTHTKFCYYNNYNLSQPRHFCKSCRRYWTHGGALRDIPSRHNPPKRPRHGFSQLTSPPQRPVPDLHVGAPGSFTGLLSSAGPGFSGLNYDFGSDLDVVGDGGAWQIGIGADAELVECSGFTWPDLTVSAPGDILER